MGKIISSTQANMRHVPALQLADLFALATSRGLLNGWGTHGTETSYKWIAVISGCYTELNKPIRGAIALYAKWKYQNKNLRESKTPATIAAYDSSLFSLKKLSYAHDAPIAYDLAAIRASRDPARGYSLHSDRMSSLQDCRNLLGGRPSGVWVGEIEPSWKVVERGRKLRNSCATFRRVE